MTDWTYNFARLAAKRAHLGVTGSIAAYRALDLVRFAGRTQMGVSATLTEAAGRFVGPVSFQALGADPVYTAMFKGEAGAFGHLAPGRAADVFAIAPATANVLAKLAHGLADDMLSAQALAFAKPLVIAPAMNPAMWAAAPVQENWQTLRERGHVCLDPDAGPVACGDQGQGRLTDVRRIFAHMLRAAADQDLSGHKVLVSLGPTREHWDMVRYMSNPSTGFMGACLALCAWIRGADVKVVAGPCHVWLPPDMDVARVVSATEMHDACMDMFPDCDVAAMTAAVADFAPVPSTEAKFKKASMAGGNLSIECQPSPDILAAMGKTKRPGQFLIGFAAEAGDPGPEAARKLADKNLDLIVANRIDQAGSGFASPTNAAHVLDASGHTQWLAEQPKPDMAWRIWDFFLDA